MALFSASKLDGPVAGSGPAAAELIVSITVPPTDSPTGTVRVSYEVSGAATSDSRLVLYCWKEVAGQAVDARLVFAGDPTDPVQDADPPIGFHIVAQSDDGSVGYIELAPDTGYYWPGPLCQWWADFYLDSTSPALGVNDTESRALDMSSVPVTEYPNLTVIPPTTDPCDPRAVVTVEYAVASGTTTNSRLTIYARPAVASLPYEDVLVFSGDPSQLPVDSVERGFELTASADSGAAGSVSLRPTTDGFWPGEICTWVAEYGTLNQLYAYDSAVQNVDSLSLAPPSGTSGIVKFVRGSAEVRTDDRGMYFSYKLRDFNKAIPPVTGRSLVVHYSVNGGETLTVAGIIPSTYTSGGGLVYFRLPAGSFVNPGSIRVELQLTGVGTATTFPVDDTLNISVSKAI